MTVSIHQPNFLPWFGYFHKLAYSDMFIFFDDVQYPRGKTFISRVKINMQNGEHWITVPIKGKSELLPIQNIPLTNGPYLKKIARTLEVTYKKTPYFQEVYDCVSLHLLDQPPSLCALNISLITAIVNRLGLATRLVRSSELGCTGHEGEDKILCLLKAVKAITYISGKGAGSNRHIDEGHFAKEGIRLVWQSFDHPIYPQLFGGIFIPNLSIVDMLFNLGFDQTRKMLMQTPISK